MHVLNAYLQTVVKRFYVLNYQIDIYIGSTAQK